MTNEVRYCDSVQNDEIIMTDWAEIILQTSTSLPYDTGQNYNGFKMNYIISNTHQSGK